MPLPPVDRIRLIIWAPLGLDEPASIYDVLEFQGLTAPGFAAGVEHALDVSDDVTVELPDENPRPPSWSMPVFMGFSQGRRTAVPCVCIEGQTVALSDLAKL